MAREMLKTEDVLVNGARSETGVQREILTGFLGPRSPDLRWLGLRLRKMLVYKAEAKCIRTLPKFLRVNQIGSR